MCENFVFSMGSVPMGDINRVTALVLIPDTSFTAMEQMDQITSRITCSFTGLTLSDEAVKTDVFPDRINISISPGDTNIEDRQIVTQLTFAKGLNVELICPDDRCVHEFTSKKWKVSVGGERWTNDDAATFHLEQEALLEREKRIFGFPVLQ